MNMKLKVSPSMFDEEKPICIATNWRKPRMGFWLLQKNCLCPDGEAFLLQSGRKNTLMGSRYMHAAEMDRYAPNWVEGESLAVANAHTAWYLSLGCLILAVDYNTLLTIFIDCSWMRSPTLCSEISRKNTAVSFQNHIIPRIKHRAADSISHHLAGTMQ